MMYQKCSQQYEFCVSGNQHPKSFPNYLFLKFINTFSFTALNLPCVRGRDEVWVLPLDDLRMTSCNKTSSNNRILEKAKYQPCSVYMQQRL